MQVSAEFLGVTATKKRMASQQTRSAWTHILSEVHGLCLFLAGRRTGRKCPCAVTDLQEGARILRFADSHCRPRISVATACSYAQPVLPEPRVGVGDCSSEGVMRRKIIVAAGIAIGLAFPASAHADCTFPILFPCFTSFVEVNDNQQQDRENTPVQSSVLGPGLAGSADATSIA